MKIRRNMSLWTKILGLFCVLFYFSNESIAQKYSNDFLNIGVDARAFGMGGSTVASTEGVNAGYWNPAGLVLQRNDWEVSLMHAEYFGGIANFDYGAASYKYSDSLAFGFSAIRFGVDNIPNTLHLKDAQGNLRYDRIKKFSAQDLAFLFSFSRKSKVKGLRYGGNVKLIRRITGEFASSWGFGLDVGVQYDWRNWTFAAMGKDITSTFNAWSFNNSELEEVFLLTGNALPENSIEYTVPQLILASSYLWKITEKIALLSELGANFTFDGKRNTLVKSNFSSLEPRLGLEMNYKRVIFLRAGVNNFQKASNIKLRNQNVIQPSLGMGFSFWKLHLDYAMTKLFVGEESLYTHVFSLKLNINKPKLQENKVSY